MFGIVTSITIESSVLPDCSKAAARQRDQSDAFWR